MSGNTHSINRLTFLFKKTPLIFGVISCCLLFVCKAEPDKNIKSPNLDSSKRHLKINSSAGMTNQEDADSIDSIVKAIYENITFTEGQKPNMERFRSLFRPKAQFIRITPDAVFEMDLDTFIASFIERIESGQLRSFFEAEILRKTNAYDRIAQVFSTYQKGMNTNAPESLIRGINSIQLYHDGKQWWVSSILWQDKEKDNPIPLDDLRQPATPSN